MKSSFCTILPQHRTAIWSQRTHKITRNSFTQQKIEARNQNSKSKLKIWPKMEICPLISSFGFRVSISSIDFEFRFRVSDFAFRFRVSIFSNTTPVHAFCTQICLYRQYFIAIFQLILHAHSYWLFIFIISYDCLTLYNLQLVQILRNFSFEIDFEFLFRFRKIDSGRK